MSINPGREVGADRKNVFRRQYQGVVIDNNDPKKLQRVKIRLRELHRGLTDDQIPWSARGPGGDQGHAGGMGNVAIPAVGARVLVTFMDNSPYFPQYSGAPDTEDTKIDDPDFLGDDYPHVAGHIDAAGNKFVVNTKEGSESISYTHKSGASWAMGSDGSFSVTGAGPVNMNAQGELNLRSTGAVRINESAPAPPPARQRPKLEVKKDDVEY